MHLCILFVRVVNICQYTFQLLGSYFMPLPPLTKIWSTLSKSRNPDENTLAQQESARFIRLQKPAPRQTPAFHYLGARAHNLGVQG